MPCLSPKDRVSLCRFTFTDGRRCRTPRSSSHPHFCYDHAQKEARACAAETLGKDLAFFFSGDYLSANDLSTALARLIPAVVQGHVKPRAASTIAYLLQTLVQAIRISQDEYINAFGTDGWRKAIRSSVNGNLDYRFPPAHEPGQSEPSQSQSAQPHAQASTPAPTPVSAPQLAETPVNCHSERSEESAFSEAQADRPQIISAPQPAETPVNCHSERSEESVFSESQADCSQISGPQHTPSPIPTPTPPPSAHPTQTPAAHPVAPAAQPNNPPPPTQPTPPRTATPNPDPYAVHFDHNYRLRESPKPF